MDFAKLIELLQAYPAWIRITAALWAIFSGILISVLIVFKPTPKTQLPPAQPVTPITNSHPTSSNTSSSISVEEVIAAVNKAPPLQKSDVSRNYVGIAIDWTGYLRSAEEEFQNSKLIRVNLIVNKANLVGESIWFTIGLDELPELKVLHKNSKLSVSGHIVSVSDPGVSVTVKPTKVRVLERVN